MRRSFYFAFFTKDGKSTVNQSQACINWYEFGGEKYFWWPYCVNKVSSIVHLSALHALLYIQYVRVYKVRELSLYYMYKYCVQ